MEGMEDDDRMGEHQEDTHGAEGRPEVIGHRHGAIKKRPYAVANVSHGTITMMCASTAIEAVLAARVNEDDVIWWTTRVSPDKSHLHDDAGRCIPTVFHAARMGVTLAR